MLESLEQSLGISSDKKVLDLLLHLPLSRELEAEADEIALVLMSKVVMSLEAFVVDAARFGTLWSNSIVLQHDTLHVRAGLLRS